VKRPGGAWQQAAVSGASFEQGQESYEPVTVAKVSRVFCNAAWFMSRQR